jgi:hypothetical protein
MDYDSYAESISKNINYLILPENQEELQKINEDFNKYIEERNK